MDTTSPKFYFKMSILSSLTFLLSIAGSYMREEIFFHFGSAKALFVLPFVAVQPIMCLVGIAFCLRDGVNIRTYPFWIVLISFFNTVATFGIILYYVLYGTSD